MMTLRLRHLNRRGLWHITMNHANASNMDAIRIVFEGTTKMSTCLVCHSTYNMFTRDYDPDPEIKQPLFGWLEYVDIY